MVRPHEDAAEAQLFDAAAGFFHRRGNIVGRDDAGAVHALGRDFAEVEHPVVVGLGDGGGEIGIEMVDGEDEQTAARIKDRDIESFLIHGAHLRDVVEIARFLFGVAFVKNLLADRPQRRIGLGRRPRHDLAVDLHAEIAFVPVQTDGRAVEIFLIDILLPEVTGFHDMHIRIHRFVTVFHDLLLEKLPA